MNTQNLNSRIERLTHIFPIIMHSFHNLSSEVSRVHELTLAQYRLIQLLHRSENFTVNEISHALGIAQSSASELVTRMVNADLLIRETSPNDRRIYQIKLSSRAEQILKERADAMHVHIQQLLAGLAEKQQEEFVQSFEKISEILSQK